MAEERYMRQTTNLEATRANQYTGCCLDILRFLDIYASPCGKYGRDGEHRASSGERKFHTRQVLTLLTQRSRMPLDFRVCSSELPGSALLHLRQFVGVGMAGIHSSRCVGTGQLVLICGVVDNPTITTTPWYVIFLQKTPRSLFRSRLDSDRQVTLFTIGIALFAVLFNMFAAKYLPVFEWLILTFHIIGFFVVIIPLCVIAPKVPAGEILGMEGVANYGGWSTVGEACVIGQLAAGGALLGAGLWTICMTSRT